MQPINTGHCPLALICCRELGVAPAFWYLSTPVIRAHSPGLFRRKKLRITIPKVVFRRVGGTFGAGALIYSVVVMPPGFMTAARNARIGTHFNHPRILFAFSEEVIHKMRGLQ
jgi:hypothetical protein